MDSAFTNPFVNFDWAFEIEAESLAGDGFLKFLP